MKRLSKIKTPTMRWPVQTKEEVDDSIKRIGELQRERSRIETEMNDELAAVKKSYEQKAEKPTEELRVRLASVQAWCESRRTTLTAASKTAKFSMGEVSWRKRPPKVSIRETEAVIQALQTNGLERFLRRKVEIDRTTILREPDVAATVKGITVSSGGEDFCSSPSRRSWRRRHERRSRRSADAGAIRADTGR